MEERNQIIIEILLENKKLKKDLKKSEDSQMYWYREYDKLKQELTEQLNQTK